MSISVLSRTRLFASVMVVAVFSALVLVGCGDKEESNPSDDTVVTDPNDGDKPGDTPGGSNPLVGTWVIEGGDPSKNSDVMIFTATELTDGGMKYPYRVTANGEIEINVSGSSWYASYTSFSIAEGELTLTNYNGTERVYIKQP